MKTELQQALARIAPYISIQTIWGHDQDSGTEWRELSKPGNCFDGADREEWQAWQSEVRATAICDGEELTGSNYLGGTWEQAGDNPAESNPEISGYEPQMTVEAIEELQKQIPATETVLHAQIAAALAHLASLN